MSIHSGAHTPEQRVAPNGVEGALAGSCPVEQEAPP